jgi:hypothetical protein
MKKYLAIFNLRTLVITILALLSCIISFYYQLAVYIDFLILGLMIFFPLTLTIKEAFKRREKALQYFSLFKACLQSVFYSIQNSKLDKEDKDAFRAIAINFSNTLRGYLLSEVDEPTGNVHEAAEQVALFVNKHKKQLKASLAQKILLFLFRLNESMEFLLATKRHQTPKTLRLIVLFSIVLFAVFYPPAVLHDAGTTISLWHLFSLTFLKVFMLISLYNVQRLLENPFSNKGTDGIRVDDFAFSATDFPHKIKKEKAEETDDDDDMDEMSD